MTSMPTTSLQAALVNSLERIRRHHWAFGDRFPTIGEGTRYQLAENDNWLAGFWPDLLWLAHVANGDEDLRAHAESLLPSFRERLDKRVHITHDLGFLFTLSARAQWQVTGSQRAQQLALQAAQELLQRYRSRGRYIQAWGEVGDRDEGGRTIIDTMMNLPLLFWASQQMGDPRYHQTALHHLDSSAGAIAAGGMLRLARLGDERNGGEFLSSALALLNSLSDRCFEIRPEAQGLLCHGTYHTHKGLGADTYFICGDYFFLTLSDVSGVMQEEPLLSCSNIRGLNVTNMTLESPQRRSDS